MDCSPQHAYVGPSGQHAKASSIYMHDVWLHQPAAGAVVADTWSSCCVVVWRSPRRACLEQVAWVAGRHCRHVCKGDGSIASTYAMISMSYHIFMEYRLAFHASWSGFSKIPDWRSMFREC